MDWDDNVMFMPTKIYVLDEDGTEVGMSTEDFSNFRNLIDKETGKTKKPFEYEGYNIIGLATNPFRDFRSGLSEFVQDIYI